MVEEPASSTGSSGFESQERYSEYCGQSGDGNSVPETYGSIPVYSVYGR
jgi:hypothetical protein